MSRVWRYRIGVTARLGLLVPVVWFGNAVTVFDRLCLAAIVFAMGWAEAQSRRWYLRERRAEMGASVDDCQADHEALASMEYLAEGLDEETARRLGLKGGDPPCS